VSLPLPVDSFDQLHPLHGRNKELNAIRAALRSVRSNAGTVITIEGAHGTGKTRLLQEIGRDMHDFDLLESPSKTGEFDRLVPFGYLMPVFGEPPIESLQNLTHHNNPYLLRDWLCEKILPSEAGRRRKKKTAILLDDFHWADEISLVALHMSLPWLFTKPVALVLTWNTGRPDLRASKLFDKPDPRTSQLFDKLEQWGSVRIRLTSLSVADSLDIARDLMPRALDPATIGLVSRAGGNPQIVVELVRGMLEESEVFSSSRIPDRLHETVRRHIDSLHERTGLVLRVAALIGESFSFSLLKDRMTVNSAEDEIALIRSIHEAKRAGLLRLDGDNIVFQNPLVWQSLAEGGGVLAQDESLGAGEPAAYESTAVGRESPATVLSTEISPMQRRIAELAIEGKTNRQIARQLYISPHTVDTHLRRIFTKLNIGSRVELTRIFVGNQL
jgi:DNA-binding CsgD family transcriptional regulator